MLGVDAVVIGEHEHLVIPDELEIIRAEGPDAGRCGIGQVGEQIDDDRHQHEEYKAKQHVFSEFFSQPPELRRRAALPFRCRGRAQRRGKAADPPAQPQHAEPGPA